MSLLHVSTTIHAGIFDDMIRKGQEIAEDTIDSLGDKQNSGQPAPPPQKESTSRPSSPSTPSPARTPPAPHYDKSLVRETQSLLNQLGYSAGTEDGLYGKGTGQAIQAYQKDTGLAVDGIPTPALLQKLRTDASKQKSPVETGVAQNTVSERFVYESTQREIIDDHLLKIYLHDHPEALKDDNMLRHVVNILYPDNKVVLRDEFEWRRQADNIRAQALSDTKNVQRAVTLSKGGKYITGTIYIGSYNFDQQAFPVEKFEINPFLMSKVEWSNPELGQFTTSGNGFTWNLQWLPVDMERAEWIRKNYAKIVPEIDYTIIGSEQDGDIRRHKYQARVDNIRLYVLPGGKNLREKDAYIEIASFSPGNMDSSLLAKPEQKAVPAAASPAAVVSQIPDPSSTVPNPYIVGSEQVENMELLLLKHFPVQYDDKLLVQQINRRWMLEQQNDNPSWGHFFNQRKQTLKPEEKIGLQADFKQWTLNRIQHVPTRIVFRDIKTRVFVNKGKPYLDKIRCLQQTAGYGLKTDPAYIYYCDRNHLLHGSGNTEAIFVIDTPIPLPTADELLTPATNDLQMELEMEITGATQKQAAHKTALILQAKVIEARYHDPISGEQISRAVPKEPEPAVAIARPKDIPYGPELIGLQLGMPFDDAVKKINEYMTVERIFTDDRSAPFSQGKMYLGKNGTEAIGLYTTMVEQQERVAAIWRRVYFEPGKVQLTSLIETLHKKFGKPAVEKTSFNGGVLEWHDLKAKKINKCQNSIEARNDKLKENGKEIYGWDIMFGNTRVSGSPVKLSYCELHTCSTGDDCGAILKSQIATETGSGPKPVREVTFTIVDSAWAVEINKAQQEAAKSKSINLDL
jgi:hypothetical protein